MQARLRYLRANGHHDWASFILYEPDMSGARARAFYQQRNQPRTPLWLFVCHWRHPDGDAMSAAKQSKGRGQDARPPVLDMFMVAQHVLERPPQTLLQPGDVQNWGSFNDGKCKRHVRLATQQRSAQVPKSFDDFNRAFYKCGRDSEEYDPQSLDSSHTRGLQEYVYMLKAQAGVAADAAITVGNLLEWVPEWTP